jgi:amidase
MLSVVPRDHAHVVRQYLEAGLVIFGKTNLPEFALKAVTDPALFGRTNNPWDFDRTPGGSSGGAAAAVAAGIVPMAAGNDGGGSIRIPAACCGLFGLKPSRGRGSLGPAAGEVWFGASSEGVISRSVRDTAAALDVLAGGEPGDPFVVAPPEASYTEMRRREPGALRIGFLSASPIGTDVHPEAIAAVADAAALLESLRHKVEEAAPEIDRAALAKSYMHIYFGQIAAAVTQARARGAKRMDWSSAMGAGAGQDQEPAPAASTPGPPDTRECPALPPTAPKSRPPTPLSPLWSRPSRRLVRTISVSGPPSHQDRCGPICRRSSVCNPPQQPSPGQPGQ